MSPDLPATGLKALVVGAQDLRTELGQTILWRAEVERREVPGFADAFEEAKRFHPKVVVVEGTDEAAVRRFLTTGWIRRCSRASSSPFSPPRSPGKGRGSVWRSCTGSCSGSAG